MLSRDERGVGHLLCLENGPDRSLSHPRACGDCQLKLTALLSRREGRVRGSLSQLSPAG